jgi:hypothetical protein
MGPLAELSALAQYISYGNYGKPNREASLSSQQKGRCQSFCAKPPQASSSCMLYRWSNRILDLRPRHWMGSTRGTTSQSRQPLFAASCQSLGVPYLRYLPYGCRWLGKKGGKRASETFRTCDMRINSKVEITVLYAFPFHEQARGICPDLTVGGIHIPRLVTPYP